MRDLGGIVMAQEPVQVQRDERSIGDLFAQLAAETGTLVRQEVTLAQTEIATKAGRVGKNIGFLAIGGAVGYAAFLMVLAAIVVALSSFMPASLAALLVGAVVGIASYFLISSAVAKLRETRVSPGETVESIKENAQWLKRQMG